MAKFYRIAFLIGLLWLSGLPAWAQVSQRSDQDILRRGASSTWVDVEHQDIQYRASPLGRDDMQNRDSWTISSSNSDFWSWLFGNGSRNSTTTSGGSGNSTFWRDFWYFVGTALYYLFWILLIVACFAILTWFFKSQEIYFFLRRSKGVADDEDIAAQRAKYSDLPVDLEMGLVGLKAQAAMLREKGEYSQAIVYLFSYLLVELDTAHCIALAKGKTNYRYLRELSPRPALHSRLKRVIQLFEEAYFGRRTISKEAFESIWSDLTRFETEIKQASERPIASGSPAEQDASLLGLAQKSFVLLFLAMALTGCNSRVSPEYGISESSMAEQSPGGLSIFREMVKARRYDTETLVSLRPSMDQKVQTIVWSPDYFPFHTKAVHDRFDQWLRQGGKTLVYIGRDYSPHAEYWEKIANAPRSALNTRDRARSKVQAAKSINHLDQMQDTYRELLITPWFYWRKTPGAFQQVDGFVGEWSDDPDLANSKISLRSTLNPLDTDELDSLMKELDWNAPVPAAAGAAPATLGVSPGSTPPPPRKLNFQVPFIKSSGTNYTKVWNTDDEELLSIAKGIVLGDRDQTKTLLASADGLPLITEIQYKSSGSRVLVLSNSSILSNLGLLNRSNRKLANRIIDTFPAGKAGFLAMDSDPPVRQGLAQEEHKGFEMLTVWPFNVMTIHAAILALVAIVAAYPIFGRPKIPPKKSQVDFGEHVESLGELLRATHGEQFAKDSISKYFRVVRRDQHSAWANRPTAEQEARAERIEEP